MLFHALSVILFFEAPRTTSAIDPFATPPVEVNCFEARETTACSETFAEAFAKMENGVSDDLTCNIKIYLFTRKNANSPEFLHNCGGILPKNTNYRTRGRTVVIVPGFMDLVCGHAAIRETKDQLLYRGNYNVIIIDWSVCAADPVIALKAVNVVGKQLAFLFENIMKETHTTGKMFHIIGHSLGAQVAGAVGKHIKNGKIRRITGLDPGPPVLHEDDTNSRLDRSDAEFVDIIHSASGPCFPYLGDYRSMGHADFFPNGGSIQMSYLPHVIEGFLKGDVPIATFSLNLYVGSHVQSLEYFKASINACECQFVGVKCASYAEFKSGRCRSCGDDGSNCAVMGMDCEEYSRPKNGSHAYYLETAMLCPYCNNTGIDMQGFNRSSKTRKQHCWPETSLQLMKF